MRAYRAVSLKASERRGHTLAPPSGAARSEEGSVGLEPGRLSRRAGSSGENRLQRLIFLLVALVSVGCSRPPALIGIDNPGVPARIRSPGGPASDLHHHEPRSVRGGGRLYSSDRAPELGLASVDVTVPPNHVLGQLERPLRLPPDPRSEFTVINPIVYRNDASFISEIDWELASRPPGQRKLLIFVHGYNNTTSDAILRV